MSVKIPILSVYDENGNQIEIPAIKGNPGTNGKSAYQYAVEAGYTDSEEQFANDLANVGETSGMPSADTMATITSLDARDALIVYDVPAGDSKKILWENFYPLVKAKLDGNITATALTDEEGTGYVATIPELEDDSVIALVGDIPTKLSELAEDTAHRTVSNAEVSAWNAKSDFSGKYADLDGKPTIPTKTSQLTNDSNFLTSVPSEYVTETELVNKKYLTSVPSEYVTETELNAKGYLTQHQDLSAYAKKTEIPTVPTKISVFNNDAGYLVKTSLSLGIASDGLIYLFINGEPVGTGIPQGQSGDVFGYVDENNTIVLNGNLADGTYSVKYEMEDGRTVNIGSMELDTNVYYSITKNLTQCSISNNAAQTIKGNSYSATITANSGYELKSVTVTMGGQAVSVTNGVINIANVTGNIVITAVAEVNEVVNLAVPNATNTTDWSIWCNNSRIGSDGKYRSSSGQSTTNLIEASKNDVFYIKGMSFTADTHTIATYTSAQAIIVGGTPAYWDSNFGDFTTLSDGTIKFTIGNFSKNDPTAFIRFSGALTGTVNDVIITKNQPIV